MKIWGDQDSYPMPHGAVIEKLRALNLPPDFSIVDIACGRGQVLDEIKKVFPECNPLGIDIEEFPEWKERDVRFKKTPLQDFIKRPSRWDVVLMTNSYRNWEGTDKVAFDKWVAENSDNFISI